MSDIVSRWPVYLTSTVGAGERDADGRLTDAAVERLAALARTAYLELCTTIDAGSVDPRGMTVQRAATLEGDAVTVSTGVIEIYPDSFTMETRVRSREDGAVVANINSTLATAAGMSNAVRDELIALAHSARFMH